MTASAIPGTGPFSLYTGRVTNWPMVVLSIALVVPLLMLGNSPVLVIPLLVVAAGALVNLLTAGSIRTAAGPNGVSVRFGVLGWPRGTYRIAQIERAEVVDLPVWSVVYGFWWTPRRTSCTVRSGPTLRLTLHSGRIVTITVPDAHAAVAAIQAAR